MSTPCGRDCNARQGRDRCHACPGRFCPLPTALTPFTDLELAFGIVLALVLLAVFA